MGPMMEEIISLGTNCDKLPSVKEEESPTCSATFLQLEGLKITIMGNLLKSLGFYWAMKNRYNYLENASSPSLL